MPHARQISSSPSQIIRGASALCRWLRCSALSALVLFATMFTASFAHAQFRTSVQGVVTDPTGAVIPGATLTLKNNATNETVVRTSSSDGVFNFNALPSSTFTLTVDHAGFQEKVLDKLQFIPEQANALNVQLNLAGTTQSVTVDASTQPILDTETASLSGTISDNQIQHMPSAGRDVFQLVQLTPGAFGDGSQGAGGGTNNLPSTAGPGGSGSGAGIFQTENAPQSNANGNQNGNNSITIDGISTVSAVWGGASVITPTIDSIGNVKVVSNDYDAEAGRFTGAQIQVTSKTGTNQFHGSLFLRINRPGLNAYQRYNGSGSLASGSPASRGLQKDDNDFNQYGGSVGGPILKNRMFFFFAYEAAPSNSATTSTGWYDTPAFDALAPAGSIASTFLKFPGNTVSSSGFIEQTCADIGLIQGTNCNEIPGQGLNLGSPLTTGLGTQDLTWQSISNPGVGSGLSDVADIADYTTVNPTKVKQVQYNGRLDADATKADHLAFAIYWVPSATTDFNSSDRPYNLYHHQQVNDAFSVIWNHTFSPSLLNEARANAAGWRWNEVNSNPQEPFGLPTDQVGVTGNITPASFGAPGPSVFDQWTYSYKDVATKVLSNHTIKFGGEATHLQYLNEPTYSTRPSFNFYNIWDFLNDAPNTESGSFNPLTGTPTPNRQDEREDLFGFFVQDDWKARPNLTFNIGLRYSYFGPLSSKEGNLDTVVLGSGANEFTGMSIRVGGNQSVSQKGNFGPEFGFAWSPKTFNNRMVVRGGFGLNYNQEEIAISANTAGNIPDVISPSFSSASPSSINPGIVYNISTSPDSLFGFPSNPNTITTFNAQNLPVAGNASVTAVPAHIPTMYTYHYSLETEYDFGHDIVATVGYQGSVSHHTILQSNAYVTGFGQGVAFNPLITSIDFYGNNGGSNNNDLLLDLKHEMAHHFQVDAQFQLAKTMDDGSTPYFESPYPYDPHASYGLADYNVGKAFKVFGLWQPVLFHGSNGWLEKVAGGWSLSGIFNLHTGFPFSAIYFAPGNLFYADSGYSSLYPVYNGGAKHITSNNAFEQGKPNLNFPLAGTANQPYFVIPNAPIPTGSGLATASGLPSDPGIGRNSFIGPGYKDLDATITKSFGLPKLPVLGENAKLEISADIFNLFNNINLNGGAIDTNILDNTFGQTNGGLGSRTIDFQARFNF
jgi:Carboxypeptidase regulatory-like domain